MRDIRLSTVLRAVFPRHRRSALQPAAPAPSAPPAPRRWIACHTPRCGHLETPHSPAGPGMWECPGCGRVQAEA
ncbi:hypothetical protein [Streptomyces sp. NPDC096153]|uniref:hypothetical protein n=1 Tax=Streptomyces sp. NPDC096153 TaxID=3155548 RepID=UPI0033306CB8